MFVFLFHYSNIISYSKHHFWKLCKLFCLQNNWKVLNMRESGYVYMTESLLCIIFYNVKIWERCATKYNFFKSNYTNRGTQMYNYTIKKTSQLWCMQPIREKARCKGIRGYATGQSQKSRYQFLEYSNSEIAPNNCPLKSGCVCPAGRRTL